MENSEDQVSENTKHKVFPVEHLPEINAQSNWLSEDPRNADESPVTGIKIQLKDDQEGTFIPDKARSKSADILSSLESSSEVFRDAIIHIDQSSEAGSFFLETPNGNQQTFFEDRALSYENINSGKQDGKDQLIQSIGEQVMEGRQAQKEATGDFSSVTDMWQTSHVTSAKITKSEEGFENFPALELKIVSSCEENTAFEIHIKSSNDSICSSLANDKDCLNENCCASDQPIDIFEISQGSDGSHYIRYSKNSKEELTTPLGESAENISREIQAERETISDIVQIRDLKTVSPNCLRGACNQLKNASQSESLEKMMKSAEFETEQFFVEKETIQMKEKASSAASQTEIETIFSIEKECDVSTQAVQTENVSKSIDFDAYLTNKENVTETSVDAEDLTVAPIVVVNVEKVKAEENQIEENCLCSCGHKKQHDCIYKCCYHDDYENIIPASIVFGQNLEYLASTYTASKCEYCRCRLNRACSEITNNCDEKLKSAIHPQYCCKCGSTAKIKKDASTCTNTTGNFEAPKSIELMPKIFKGLASGEKILHQPPVKIVKSSEQLKEKKRNNIAVKIMKMSKSLKFEKVAFMDMPLVIEYCLNSNRFSELARPKLTINPMDIKLSKKVRFENISQEQKKKCSIISLPNSDKKKQEELCLVFNEKKSIESECKLDFYYSYTDICPYNMYHRTTESVQKKEKNSILLMYSSGAFRIQNNGSSSKHLRNVSPRIKPEYFDYLTKDGWKPYDRNGGEFLSTGTDATDIVHFEKILGDSFESFTEGLNNACEIVNDHLLNLRLVDEDKVRQAAEILHKHWFAVVGSKYSDVVEVRNFIKYFKGFSNNLVKTLLHSVDNNGNNVLHFAFANNKFDLVDELLKSGFALDLLNKGNKSGNTPLMICAISQPQNKLDWTVVRRCFEFSDVNEKSVKNGQTPLMHAASRGFQKMVDLLLDIGANPNLQDKDGSTALMYAAEHGHPKCVKSLVRHQKCDPTIKDEDGETACSVALINGHKDIAVLIHMQALEKRRLLQNLYSTRRFIWTHSNKRVRKKTSAAVSNPMTADVDFSWETY